MAPGGCPVFHLRGRGRGGGRGTARLVARFGVLVAWGLPCTLLGAVSLLLRRGPADAGWLLGVGAVSLWMAVVLAMIASPLRHRAAPVYGPVAAVLAAALATVVGTA